MENEIIKFFEDNLSNVTGTKITHIQLEQIVHQAKTRFIKPEEKTA